MSNENNVIVEFDQEKRILHLSAREPNHVCKENELNTLCSSVQEIIKSYCTDERCYMIVNLASFIIEPDLFKQYAEKISSIYEKYIFPNGLARYGYQVTRVTVRLAQMENESVEPLLFTSKDEAFKYVNRLIEQNLSEPDKSRIKTESISKE